MMITILRISSVYLITYIISLCGRKTRAQSAPVGASASSKAALQPSTMSKHPAGPGGTNPLKAQSGDEEDDFKFQLNIKKSENKKEDDFDDDDEENPLVKLSVKQRKKMAGSMRQRANHAKATGGGDGGGKTMVKKATGASVMENPDDQEQNLFGGSVGTSKGVSCYQFEVKQSARKMKSAKNPKPISPAGQPPVAAPPAKPITSDEKAKNSAEKPKPATPEGAGKLAAMSEKTKQTQRTVIVPTSEKKPKIPLVISPAPVDKGSADKNGGSISRAVSVTQITEEVVREDSLKDKDKEHGDLKPVEFTNSPMNKR